MRSYAPDVCRYEVDTVDGDTVRVRDVNLVVLPTPALGTVEGNGHVQSRARREDAAAAHVGNPKFQKNVYVKVFQYYLKKHDFA